METILAAINMISLCVLVGLVFGLATENKHLKDKIKYLEGKK